MSDYRGHSRRGGGNGYRGDHDDRTVTYVSSQSGRSRGGFKSKNRVKRNVGHFQPRHDGKRIVDDGDVDMDGDAPSASRQRHSPYDSRGGRGRGRGYRKGGRGGREASLRAALGDGRDTGAYGRLGVPFRSAGLQRSKSGWYKVTIPYGSVTGKDFVLKSLTEKTTVPFQPVQTHEIGTSLMFFINDHDGAQALKECSRLITAPNGRKVLVTVIAANQPPETSMSQETIDKIKIVMSNRYDPPTKKLDLSNMYNDTDLRAQNIYLSIGRQNVAVEVLKIIGEHIPELQQLDLSNNRLHSLVQFAKIHEHAPNLTALNLSKNQLKNALELQHISKLTLLIELCLDKNPLCDNYANEDTYVSAIRKKFPKVTVLDGHQLPPPITFDVESSVALPDSMGSRFPNQETEALICAFLKQYYNIFDSDNRQPLLDAYHDNAVFSLCTAYNGTINHKQDSFSYMMESRNMLKLHGNSKEERLSTLQKTSKLAVVAALEKFPRTKHDPGQFRVDVSLATPVIYQFTVFGVFAEVGGHRDPIRTFSRCFITVPITPERICIINEQFTISNATEDQVKKYKASAVAMVSPTSPTPAAAVSSPQQAATGFTDQQKQMVLEFAAKSTMNEEFSLKCLSECGWDFERAAIAFTEAKAKGAIPPQAFVK